MCLCHSHISGNLFCTSTCCQIKLIPHRRSVVFPPPPPPNNGNTNSDSTATVLHTTHHFCPRSSFYQALNQPAVLPRDPLCSKTLDNTAAQTQLVAKSTTTTIQRSATTTTSSVATTTAAVSRASQPISLLLSWLTGSLVAASPRRRALLTKQLGSLTCQRRALERGARWGKPVKCHSMMADSVYWLWKVLEVAQ